MEELAVRHAYHRHGPCLIHFDREKMTLIETLYHRYRRLKKEAHLAQLAHELAAKRQRSIKRHHRFIVEPVHIHFNRRNVHGLAFH